MLGVPFLPARRRSLLVAVALVIPIGLAACAPDQADEPTESAVPSVSSGADPGPERALPGSLAGIMPEAHGHLGPYRDGNGNLYTVVEDLPGDEGGNEPKAMKSADGGATWTEIDRGGRTSTGDLEGNWAIQVGSRIFFAFQKSSGGIFLTAFDTSDAPATPDTWSVVREEIHEPDEKPEDQWVSISALSNGDIWAFYSTEPTDGHSHRIGFRKRSSDTGTYGSQAVLDPDRTVSQAVAVQGDGDVTHVFYKDHVEQQLFYGALSADGTLSAPVRVDRTGTHEVHSPMTNAVVHRVGGAEHVTVAWADGAGMLVSADVVDGVPTAEQRVSDVPVPVDPGKTTNLGAVAHLAADRATVHALFADAETQDIWYDARTGDGGFGTDVEAVDGVTTQWLSGLLPFTDSGGRRVLGFLYDTGPHGDDEGIIRYDEHVLPADED
jgi:hypothetical protein